jgi:hypothetical protein
MVPPSLHATSAGTISVAIWPSAEARIASTASRPTADEAEAARSHLEHGCAMASMLEVNGVL